MSADSHARLVEWFREWRSPIRRFLGANRSVPRDDIDDVAQEVFLRMLRYDCSELVTQPQSYLFKIAANVAAEWSMRSSRRRPHAAEWLENLVTESGPEADLMSQMEEEQVKIALEALPPRARQVVQLHFAESLTHEQVAAKLGITRRVVKRELINAYAALRLSLRAEEAERAGMARSGYGL